MISKYLSLYVTSRAHDHYHISSHLCNIEFNIKPTMNHISKTLIKSHRT